MALRLPSFLDGLSRTFRRAPVVSRAVNAASSNWTDDPRTISASADVHASRAIVGDRVAGLYLNDPVVHSAVSILTSLIVGSGVRLNTADQVVDHAFNTSRLDPSRHLTSASLQQAVIRSWAVYGEFLALHVVLAGRYAVQVLHPSQLDAAKNEDLGGGGRIIQGVELDAFDRVIAYWIVPQAPGDPFASISLSERREARDVLHVFEREFPGQVRGAPPLTAVLPVLNTASTAVDAMIKRLQASAMFVAAITSAEMDGAFDGDPNPSMEPGAILRFRPGETFQSTQGGEAGDLPNFLKTLYRQIAAAIGVTYEDLIGDLEGVNYSSFRGGALTARRKAEARRRALLVEGFLDPLFERWQAIERLGGRRTIALEAAWIEPSWPSIDPLKEVEAEIAAMNANLKSRKEIIEARGREFETVNSEIEADPLPRLPEPAQ